MNERLRDLEDLGSGFGPPKPAAVHKAAAPDASERPHAAPFTRRLPANVEELRAQQVEARASGDGDISGAPTRPSGGDILLGSALSLE